jgi:hypothetical protein
MSIKKPHNKPIPLHRRTAVLHKKKEERGARSNVSHGTAAKIYGTEVMLCVFPGKPHIGFLHQSRDRVRRSAGREETRPRPRGIGAGDDRGGYSSHSARSSPKSTEPWISSSLK